MSEQDHMDQLLSQAMSAPAPTLSSDFDQRLTRRMPARLDRRRRLILIAYAVVALVVSVWSMLAVGLGWSMVAGFVFVPLGVVAVVFRRHLRNCVAIGSL